MGVPVPTGHVDPVPMVKVGYRGRGIDRQGSLPILPEGPLT
jgi:hypothetical protein